jgi:hypothetical protein
MISPPILLVLLSDNDEENSGLLSIRTGDPVQEPEQIFPAEV